MRRRRHLNNRFARPQFLFAAVFVVALGSDAARAAPAGLPEQALDIELREAEVASVFALLGQVGRRTIALDPCVQGVDVHLPEKISSANGTGAGQSGVTRASPSHLPMLAGMLGATTLERSTANRWVA